MTSAVFASTDSQDLRDAKSRLVIEQAIAALCAGDPVEAERTLQRHLLQAPNDADALTKLAEIAILDHRMEYGTLYLRRAATADPSAQRQLALAAHLLAFAGPAAALAEIEAASANRSTFDLRAFEAALLGMLGKHDRQLLIYEQLIVERPADPAPYIHKAIALNTVGRVEEAVAALRQAIQIRPACGAAYWALANLKSQRFTDQDVADMRKAIRGRLGDDDRLHFEFALGRALELRQAYQESFDHYAAANRFRSAQLPSEQMQVTAFVDEAIGAFNSNFLNRKSGAGFESSDPIFLVGLHRSGSTLIEQILATHPGIEGSGELPVMQQIWDRIVREGEKCGRSPFEEMARYDASRFRAIGAEYIERTRAFRQTDRPQFVDKLPSNWLRLGLIRLALPNAKIIDARRHPMACGFSNFKQHYAMGVYFAYSLASIGLFYRDYLRLMDHFDCIQPTVFHHVVNEQLIEHPEREVRRMLDYLGVPFHAECLNFHRNARAVSTPSAQQVRRPLNRDGVDAWRAYEPWLGDLKEALGPALDNWVPA